MPRRTARDLDPRLAIRTRDLSVRLGGVDILTRINAEFVHTGINALIGPNGAGKTTLVRALLGLAPYTGMVELRPGRGGGAPALAYVPQRVDFDRGTPVKVCDLLCADRQRRPLFLGHKPAAVEQARQKLRLVGAERVFDSPLGRLSGGEFQRVLLALALLSDPDVLLLDEPVAGVDVAGEQLFCDLLVRLRDEARITIILVSHEMSVVVQHTNHVVCLSERGLECQGDTLATLNAANIERIFGYHAAIYEHGHEHKPGEACTHPHGHHHPHIPPERTEGPT